MKLPNAMAKKIYGMTQTEAWARSICIKCHKPPPQLPKTATYAQIVADREYTISALCSPCFDELFNDDEDS